jgi:hypothetical protein
LPSRRQIALATLLAGVSFGPLSYYLVDEEPLPCSIYSSATYIRDFLCWRKLKLGFWDFGSQSFVYMERLCLHKHFIAWEDNLSENFYWRKSSCVGWQQQTWAFMVRRQKPSPQVGGR